MSPSFRHGNGTKKTPIPACVGALVTYEGDPFTVVAANEGGVWCARSHPPFIVSVGEIVLFSNDLMEHLKVVSIP